MGKVFVSYFFEEVNSSGFGNVWIEIGSVDSVSKVREMEDFILGLKPERYRSITILNWRRFEESEGGK